MRPLLALLLISSALFSDELETFFKASKDNEVFCRKGYSSYVILTPANASLVTINKTKYFKYKNEDIYLPTSSCKMVEKNN